METVADRPVRLTSPERLGTKVPKGDVWSYVQRSFLVLSRADGQSLGEFHQVIDGKGTAIQEVGGKLKGRKPQATFDAPINNPEGAAQHGRDMAGMGTLKGKNNRHNPPTNDCVTGACNVANGGGSNVSSDTVRQNLDMH